jgi:hypothetical protein
VSACRRVGVGERRNGGSAGRRMGERNGVSAGRHAWRGRVALPRDRRCTSGNFPFADYAATALYPTFTPFCLFKFYNVQRRSRGSATLPRYACRYADTPTRRFVSPARRPADPPIRRFVSPDSPSLTLAVFRQERAGICASMLTKPGKRPASCFRLIQIQSSVGGCSPVDSALLDVRWRIARGARPLRLSFIF